MAKRMTDEFLLDELRRYIDHYKEVPLQEDFVENKNFPSLMVYKRRFGSWSNALSIIGIKLSDVFEDRKEKKINISLEGLKKLYIQLGRSPKVNEYETFAKENSLLQRRNLETNMGIKYNDICLKYLGEANEIIKSKEQILNELINLKNQLGRSPMACELKEYGLPKVTKYQSVFGMTYNEIIKYLGWEISGHSFTNKNNEELLQDYLELYKKLNRLPFREDINNQNHMAHYETYRTKFGGIKQICELLKIDYRKEIEFYKSGEGIICFDRNGDQCRSYTELVISNILIDNNIICVKEYPYKKVIPNDKTRRTFDWKIMSSDIYIEYFGMYDEKSLNGDTKYSKYTKKAIKKMDDCERSNIKLISILPSDLKNNYLGLINKLSLLDLDVKMEMSYENIL